MDIPPLVITGMHRSGTSATARLLQHAGLDIGSDLLAPNLDNRLGYYEDLEFCDLNLALLAAGIEDAPEYRPDWAFADRIVPSRLAPLRPRAQELIAARHALGHAWGFKDPRTAVLLDFYDDLLPEARYLFVYRAPWEVLTSLMSTQQRPLHGRADVAVRAWTTYNSRLLEFRQRHPERTVLVHLDAVAQQPEAVVALVQDRAEGLALAQLDAAAAGDAFVGRLLRRTDAASPLAELLAADHPEALAVYDRLEADADIAALEPRRSRGEPQVEIEVRSGPLPVAAVLVGAPADGVEDTTHVARPAAGVAPGEAADASIGKLDDELVAVLFAGQLRPQALTAAVAALENDAGIGAVLLAPGDVALQPAVEHDPLSAAEGGAGIVVRRATWVAAHGFAATPGPAGYEAWAFAVACLAAGWRTARVAGAIHLPDAAGDDADVRRRTLAAHPALAVRRAEQAAERADAAETERARAVLEVEQLHATRAWRLVGCWWRVRARLPGRHKG